MMDATCPVIHAALQASEKGIPFIPLRGLIGSDILKIEKIGKLVTIHLPMRRMIQLYFYLHLSQTLRLYMLQLGISSKCLGWRSKSKC